MTLASTGKSCTVVLAHWPRGAGRRQNHHRGITLLQGLIQVADGLVYLLPTGSPDRVLIPPHLVDEIETVTDELRNGLEIDLDTQLCLRAYYSGRPTLKTLGWNAILAQSSAAPTVK